MMYIAMCDRCDFSESNKHDIRYNCRYCKNGNHKPTKLPEHFIELYRMIEKRTGERLLFETLSEFCDYYKIEREVLMSDYRLEKWEYRGDKVCLKYPDGEKVFVHRTDFNRAFGAIINASKEDVKRDFAIENKESGIREMSIDERSELELKILEILKLSVSSEYAMKILLKEEECTESTLLGDIVLDVQETSAWNDEGIYTDDDIRLSIGRKILYRLGEIV